MRFKVLLPMLAVGAIFYGPSAAAGAQTDSTKLTAVLQVRAFLNYEKYPLDGNEFTFDIYKNGSVVGQINNPQSGESFNFPLYESGDEAGFCEVHRSAEMQGFILQDYEAGCQFQTMAQPSQDFIFVYKKFASIKPYVSFTWLKDRRVHPGSLSNFWFSFSGDRIDRSATKLVSVSRPRMLKLMPWDSPNPFVDTSRYYIAPTQEPTITDFGPPSAPTWFRGRLHENPQNFRVIRLTWRIPWRARHLRRGTKICFTLGFKARGTIYHADSDTTEPTLVGDINKKFCFLKAGRRR